MSNGDLTNKAVVVLSHRAQGEEFNNRLNLGIKQYFENKFDFFILLSESVNKKNLQTLKNCGIMDEKILLVPESRDTIGEAIFLNKTAIAENNIGKICVVSSDYHIDYRAKAIFDYFYGDVIEVDYCKVNTNKIKDKNVIKDQLRSASFFYRLISTQENVVEIHPLYSGEK